MLLSGCDTFDFISWRKYYNNEYRFSILLPRGWQQGKFTPDTLIMAKAPLKGDKDKYQENINVNVTELPSDAKGVSLDTIFDLNKEELQRTVAEVYDLRDGDIYAGFLPGKWMSFEGKAMGLSIKIITAIWLKNNRFYVVTCSAEVKDFPRYEPIFKKALHSVRIK